MVAKIFDPLPAFLPSYTRSRAALITNSNGTQSAQKGWRGCLYNSSHVYMGAAEAVVQGATTIFFADFFVPHPPSLPLLSSLPFLVCTESKAEPSLPAVQSLFLATWLFCVAQNHYRGFTNYQHFLIAAAL
jgi:hypothetical protein